MGEIRSISRSHFMPIASEPLNPRGRECLACAAVFLAKSDFHPCLSDLAYNGAVPRDRVGVFMEARATVPKHGPRAHWPDAGRRQRRSQGRPPAAADDRLRADQALAQDFGCAPRLALEHALVTKETKRDDVRLPDTGPRRGEVKRRHWG